MTEQQITANFQAKHKAASSNVVDAQHEVMAAQAKLANARTVVRELEKQYREDMKTPTPSNQGELPLDTKKK